MILKLTASSLYNEMGEGVLDRAKQLLAKWLRRNEAEVIDSSSQAASSLFILLDEKQRENWISELLGALSENYRDGQDKGIISVLFKIFPSVSASVKVSITQGLHARWNSGHKIETRAAILRYLGESKALISQTSDFVDIIADGLDDYTTNARGDVGSLVRIEAVQTTGSIWEAIQSKPGTELDIFNRLFGKVLRLAVEKLDKVRAEAQKAVAQALRSDSKIAWYESASFTKIINQLTLTHFPGCRTAPLRRRNTSNFSWDCKQTRLVFFLRNLKIIGAWTCLRVMWGRLTLVRKTWCVPVELLLRSTASVVIQK